MMMNKITPQTKKITTIIFVVFFILFSKYVPYANSIQSNSLGATVFNLYFFILSQTFGIVHEAGHGVCYILHCPEFITALNGTIFQVGFPLGIAYYYKKHSNFMVMWIAMFFVGFTLHYTSWYISTAHEGLFLPAYKSFLGVDGKHDFNYVLNAIGVLKYDGFISKLVKVIANLIMLFSLYKMYILAFVKDNKESKI